LLIGDATKAKTKLGWQAETRFEALAQLMVKADVELLTMQMQGRQDVHVVDLPPSLVAEPRLSSSGHTDEFFESTTRPVFANIKYPDFVP
jgi:hypothetical protein